MEITKNQGDDIDAFLFAIMVMSLNHLLVLGIIYVLFDPYFDLVLEDLTLYLIPLVVLGLNAVYIYTGNRRQVILELKETLPLKLREYRRYILFLTHMGLLAILFIMSILRAQ